MERLHQASLHLRQSGGAAKRAARPSASCRPPKAISEQTIAEADGSDRPLPQGLRRIQEGARRDAQAACTWRRRSACWAAPTRSSWIRRAARASCRTCRSISSRSASRSEERTEPCARSSLSSSLCLGVVAVATLFLRLHRASERAGARAAIRQAEARHHASGPQLEDSVRRHGRDTSTSASSISIRPPQEVTASDQKRLIVDAFARYRIIDPAASSIRTFDMRIGVRELGPLIESEIRRVLGAATFQEVVQRQARRPDEADRQPGQQGRPGVRTAGGGRAHQARRPARSKTRKSVYDRMRAERSARQRSSARKAKPRANRIRAKADKRGDHHQGGGDREGRARPRRRRCRAQQHLRGGLRPRSGLLRASIGRCRPTRPAIKPEETRMLLSPGQRVFPVLQDPNGGAKPATAAPAQLNPAMSDLLVGLGWCS